MLIFLCATLVGIGLLSMDLYGYIWSDPMVFSIGVAVSAILSIIVALRLAYLPFSRINTQLNEIEVKNRLNQDAILQLLDEMGDLADGDLSVTATVTEEITGAIADSVNHTVDALRDLIQNINSTTVHVSFAAQETQATAIHLTDASEHQTQQITEVSKAMSDMAISVEQVSENASQSSDVAQQSVQLAAQGRHAVNNSITGMDTIREHIQETSKRIKRLGESSQEIGNVVELINDIAEQTNILSLNAAIQATMAGEAGRGFAVVADEVQRLAERSSKATKHIDALVRTIQSDTSEAIRSMEKSTSEVVSGAQLSQDAGTALEQIEAVSNQLATLINNISDAAKQQAEVATSTSDTISVIQEIAIQTTTGTNESAASIGRLLNLTDDLHASVSGFKLPL